MAKNYRAPFFEALLTLALMLSGLLSGAMLLIAIAIVPYWQGMAPQEFQAWFNANGSYLGRVMVPLALGSLACVLVTAVFMAQRGRATLSIWMAAGLLIALFATYISVVDPINATLATHPLQDAVISELLNKWAEWHLVRMAFGIGAFLCCLRSIVRTVRPVM